MARTTFLITINYAAGKSFDVQIVAINRKYAIIKAQEKYSLYNKNCFV